MICCAYAVIHVRCNTCSRNATFCPGLTERNKMLELFEMLSPDHLIETIPTMDGGANYKSQPVGWRIDVEGNAYCPQHA